MKKTAIINSLIKKKVVTAVFVTASIAAFATFGEGGRKDRGNSLNANQSRYFHAKIYGGYLFNV